MSKASIIAIFCSVILFSCNGAASFRTDEGGVWNTTYHITYRSSADLGDSIRAVMKRVEMSLSPFNPESVISRINRGETAQTDSLIQRIFHMSQEVCRASGGMFDPTVSPLVNLWGFGFEKHGGEPETAEIDSALSLVGILGCALSPEGVISKKHPATQFNFSAITKGYGVDLIGEMLRRNGVEDYLVEIGGEIAVSGRNRHGEPWRVMIDSPIECDSAIVHSRMAVTCPQLTGGDKQERAAVATSGNYRNYRISSGGTKVWHTINPLTGRPAVTDAVSATVIAPECGLADALATACMALGSERAIAMLDSIGPSVAALIVKTQPSDTALTIVATPNFPRD